MNFFFGIKNKDLSSQITIPKFQNTGLYENNYNVYEVKPLDKKWIIKRLQCREDDNFFFVDENDISVDNFFFLSNENEITKKYDDNFSKLLNLNTFTDTHPSAFRSNLRIYLNGGGFSSYQSEYPYEMTCKNGNILSPINALLDPNADRNLIFFKNIFHLPIQENSFIYFFDIVAKKVIKKIEIKSNFLNEMEVSNDLIKSNIFIFSKIFLGIPLYVTMKNKHISFEHTHPPHHYILSDDKFKQIANLKYEINEFIV
jgi:hypothetical protein